MSNVIEIGTKFFVETSIDSNGRPCAKLVQNTPKAKWGKTKTLKNFWFKSEMSRNAWVDETVNQLTKNETVKLERKELSKKALQNAIVKVGDIFSHSWGWEQTNIQFYQVIAIKNQTVQLHEVYQNRTETGFMCGNCSPIINNFKTECNPFSKRIKCLPDGTVYVSTECGWCKLWDGRDESYSCYA